MHECNTWPPGSVKGAGAAPCLIVLPAPPLRTSSLQGPLQLTAPAGAFQATLDPMP